MLAERRVHPLLLAEQFRRHPVRSSLAKVDDRKDASDGDVGVEAVRRGLVRRHHWLRAE